MSVSREKWEAAAAGPLAVLGVGFLVAYSVLVLASELPRWLVVFLTVELALTWIAFALDLVVRVSLTERGARSSFLARHPIDVLSVLFPLFRAFRVADLLRSVRYFRSRSGDAVRARVLAFAATYAVLFIYFMALATLQAERSAPGATITDIGTALWWACVTIATVGYGDAYPITTLGRLYAVILMAGGVAIVGTATALVISYLGDRIRTIHDRQS